MRAHTFITSQKKNEMKKKINEEKQQHIKQSHKQRLERSRRVKNILDIGVLTTCILQQKRKKEKNLFLNIKRFRKRERKLVFCFFG